MNRDIDTTDFQKAINKTLANKEATSENGIDKMIIVYKDGSMIILHDGGEIERVKSNE